MFPLVKSLFLFPLHQDKRSSKISEKSSSVSLTNEHLEYAYSTLPSTATAASRTLRRKTRHRPTNRATFCVALALIFLAPLSHHIHLGIFFRGDSPPPPPSPQISHACLSSAANRTLPEGDTPPRKPPPPAAGPKGDLLLPPPKNRRVFIFFEECITPVAPLKSPPPPPPTPPTEMPSPTPPTPPPATDGLTARMVCTAPPGPQKKPPSLVALVSVRACVHHASVGHTPLCSKICMSVCTICVLACFPSHFQPIPIPGPTPWTREINPPLCPRNTPYNTS